MELLTMNRNLTKKKAVRGIHIYNFMSSYYFCAWLFKVISHTEHIECIKYLALTEKNLYKFIITVMLQIPQVFFYTKEYLIYKK